MREGKGRKAKVRLAPEDFILSCRGRAMQIAITGCCRPEEDGVNHLKNLLERSHRFEDVAKAMAPGTNRKSYQLLTVKLPLDMPFEEASRLVHKYIAEAAQHLLCKGSRNVQTTRQEDRGVVLAYAHRRHRPVWHAA